MENEEPKRSDTPPPSTDTPILPPVAVKKLGRAVHRDFQSWLDDQHFKNLYLWFLEEWQGVKKGIVLFAVLAAVLLVAVGLLEYFVFSRLVYEPRLAAKNVQIQSGLDNLNKQRQDDAEELSQSIGARQEAERDRDKYQLMFQNDENTMAPLRQAANEHFFSAPPDKRIDLLIQKLDSLRSEMDSKVAGQPPSGMIFAATADIVMTVVKDKQTAGSVMLIGGGVAVGFGNGPNALLIAGSQTVTSQLVGDNQIQFIVQAVAPPNSPYMGKPITSLADAKYMEIDLSSFTPSGTVVVGGSVTWVINYAHKASFDIPAQKTTDSRVVIPDVASGITQLSSASDKPTSQP